MVRSVREPGRRAGHLPTEVIAVCRNRRRELESQPQVPADGRSATCSLVTQRRDQRQAETEAALDRANPAAVLDDPGDATAGG